MTNNVAPLILVVDDEPGFVEVIQAKLESQGFHTISASDGDEAVAKAKKFAPALILMDIEMPDKDGITAADELATDPTTKDIPSIFVTNLSQETAGSLAKKVSLHLDDNNYFRKDGDYVFLLRQIKSYVTALKPLKSSQMTGA